MLERYGIHDTYKMIVERQGPSYVHIKNQFHTVTSKLYFITLVQVLFACIQLEQCEFIRVCVVKTVIDILTLFIMLIVTTEFISFYNIFK